jgi:hypothetical protein
MTLASARRLYSADPQNPVATATYEFRSARDLKLKESWFQEVIAANPGLVIEPCQRGGLTNEEWYFWAREFSVSAEDGAAGSVDVLLISTSGRIGIVETKLAYNPEKRRNVVAQVLDYAVNISEMNPEELPRLPETQGEPVATADDVQTHLAEGDHLLIIAGDELDPRAIKLSQAMLGEHLASPWQLALVELSPCQRISGQDGPSLILVPSLRSALRPELRQIVRVVVEGESPKAHVTIERVPPSGDKNRLWTEEEFLQNVERLGQPGRRARQLAEGLIALGRSVSDSVDPYRAPSKNGSAIFDLGEVGLFTLYPEGLYIRVLRNVGTHGAPGTDHEWNEVVARLNACQLGAFTQKDLGHARMMNRPLAAMTDEEVTRFKQFVQWFAEQVRQRQHPS